jgi:moderate conductance mechanosensitive channel
LRAYDGSVYTIPFGSIDVVTNMMKDFSFWVFNLRIAYRENYDEVVEILHGIDEQLRKEWPYRRIVLAPLEIAGLNRFGESAMEIMARIKTRPGDQWRVGREFQRRIKMAFDEHGIEIPFPHQTVYFGRDKEGRASPLMVEELHRRAAAKEEGESDLPRAADAARSAARG